MQGSTIGMNYEALKDELLNDPIKLGYNELIEKGDDTGLCNIINANSGPSIGVVTLPSMSRNDFLLALAPVYLILPNLSTLLQNKWDRILNVISAADRIDLNDQRVQVLLSSAVIDGVLTAEQVIALNQRTGSRAEVVLGAGTSVTESDIAKALRG